MSTSNGTHRKSWFGSRLKRMLRLNFLGRSTPTIMRAARAEAGDIDGHLHAHRRDLTLGYSSSYLAHSLARCDIFKRMEFRISYVAALILIGIPVLALYTGILERRANVDTNTSIFAYYLGCLLFSSRSILRREGSFTNWRNKKYYVARKRSGSTFKKNANFWSLILMLSIYLAMTGIFVFQLDPGEVRPTLIASVGLFLWAGIFMTASAPLRDGRMLIRLAPESALVRSLANAYTAIVRATPAQWRVIEHRCRVAAEISSAAAIIDGPMLRRLSASGASASAPKAQQLRQCAAALRDFAATAVVGGTEARSELRAGLGRALTAAATGNLDKLPRIELAETAAAKPSRIARAAGAIKTLIVAIIPPFAIGLLLVVGESRGWQLATDTATRNLLIQFAGLWLLGGLVSSLDPGGYQQRLGAVTGAGSTLFGWNRSRS